MWKFLLTFIDIMQRWNVTGPATGRTIHDTDERPVIGYGTHSPSIHDKCVCFTSPIINHMDPRKIGMHIGISYPWYANFMTWKRFRITDPLSGGPSHHPNFCINGQVIWILGISLLLAWISCCTSSGFSGDSDAVTLIWWHCNVFQCNMLKT